MWRKDSELPKKKCAVSFNVVENWIKSYRNRELPEALHQNNFMLLIIKHDTLGMQLFFILKFIH